MIGSERHFRPLFNNNNLGRVAQLVERSLSILCMRKVLGSIPSSSKASVRCCHLVLRYIFAFLLPPLPLLVGYRAPSHSYF